MVANILPVDTPALGVKSKLYLYENMVMSHVKLKGNIQAYILSLDITSTPLEVRSKFKFVLEHGHIAYQIKGNSECSNMQAHIRSPHIHDPLGGVKGQNIFF